MKKRFIAVILCLAAVFTLSVGAFADTGEDLFLEPINEGSEMEITTDVFIGEQQKEYVSEFDMDNEFYSYEEIAKGGGSTLLDVPLFKQDEDYYCAPACGAMVLSYFGIDVTQYELTGSDDMETTKKGTIVCNVTKCLNNRMGYTAYKHVLTSEIAFNVGLTSSIGRGFPVICNVQTEYLPYYNGKSCQHYVVATGYKWAQGGVGSGGYQNVIVNDPHYDDKYFGEHECDIFVMAEAIAQRADYYIMAN